MLTTEAPDVNELPLQGSTTKEAGVLALQFSTTRDADEGVPSSSRLGSTFSCCTLSPGVEGCGSDKSAGTRFVMSCSSVSVTILLDSGVVTTVLDDGISVSVTVVVASGLVTTVLDEVFLLFLLVFTSDRASRFS